jgi:hypothetical protein
MHSAGARAVRGDDNQMSREAVLLQWERKIEAEERKVEAEERKVEADERREEGRFTRSSDRPQHADADTPDAPDDADAGTHSDTEAAEPMPLRPVEDATHPEPRRFERRPTFARRPAAPVAQPAADRRTITITGNPTPARRRRPVMDAQLAQPDRIALWAFLLGLFLVAVAAGTAHA